MKKSFTLFAAALLLAGCNKVTSYDDTFVMEKLSNLEQRVTALESSIQSVQSTLGDGKFVQKVQELTDETGKTVGITVTYTTGEVVNFTISKVTDPDAAPVLSVVPNGAGELCWAIDGVILRQNGQDVLVYRTPSFEVGEDGHLYAVVDGDKIDLGNVKGEKGDPGKDGKDGKDGQGGSGPVQDGIFKAISVGEATVTLTLADDSTIILPLAKAFALVIAQKEYLVKDTKPIEIPYSVTNATANTIVDVFCDNQFYCEVLADKIVVTPASKDVEGMILVYADSRNGLTSIVKLIIEGEVCKVTDAKADPESGIDYIVDFESAAVDVNLVSNVAFEVKPQVEWLKVTATKAAKHVVTITADDNKETSIRTGEVQIVRAGTTDVLQTIVIAQMAFDPSINLSKKESANCYIVPAAGEYKFAAVKGNSSESVGAVASAEIIWETWNNMEDVTANSVIASVESDGSFIKFATPEAYHTGNALIAAKDANGTILWSWHIWATDKTIQGTDCGYDGEALVMNYNLGAIDELGTTGSLGLQYQWGRKDPFIGGGDLGHSDLATISGTEMTKTTDRLSEETATQNPTLFYIVGDNGKDWFAGDAFDRWATEKTVNDPCPAGWRAAHYSDNTIFKASSVTFDSGNFTFTVDDKVTFPVSGTLYYESGDFDKNDSIYHFGDDYNTTTPNGWRMRLDKASGSKTAVRKASGGAVRCVAITAE